MALGEPAPATTTRRLGVDVAWAPHPLGHGVGHGPPAGAVAEGGGGLELLGAASGVEVPGAEVGEHLGGGVLAVGLARTGEGQLVAARGLERPPCGGAVLDGLGAEVGVHEAASRARASRIRCISMLPDATVADTEYRWWSSTALRKVPLLGQMWGRCSPAKSPRVG